MTCLPGYSYVLVSHIAFAPFPMHMQRYVLASYSQVALYTNWLIWMALCAAVSGSCTSISCANKDTLQPNAAL